MNIKTHIVNDKKIAEVNAESIVIHTVEDGLNILGNLYYSDFDRIIIHDKNITAAFYDLKTGMAGEILQKFSNYRVRLVIIGDFDKYQSNSIKAFIFESNKSKQVNFVGSLTEALQRLAL
jgi:hypothetical protein